MTVCQALFDASRDYQSKKKMWCPMKIFPGCHPKAPVDVFVDGKKRVVTLVCSKCDQTVATIKVRGKLPVSKK